MSFTRPTPSRTASAESSRLSFVGTRGVTNGEANGEPRGQRPKDHRNRIFPKEQFGPFPRETPSSPDLFTATGWRFQDAGWAAPTFSTRRVLFCPQRFVVHKIIFDRIHHQLVRDCSTNRIGPKAFTHP